MSSAFHAILRHVKPFRSANPSVNMGSLLATRKNVAGKPYRSRMGTACSNWHRSPSSNVRETSAGLSIRPGFFPFSSRLRAKQFFVFGHIFQNPWLNSVVANASVRVYAANGCCKIQNACVYESGNAQVTYSPSPGAYLFPNVQREYFLFVRREVM